MLLNASRGRVGFVIYWLREAVGVRALGEDVDAILALAQVDDVDESRGARRRGPGDGEADLGGERTISSTWSSWSTSARARYRRRLSVRPRSIDGH